MLVDVDIQEPADRRGIELAEFVVARRALLPAFAGLHGLEREAALYAVAECAADEPLEIELAEATEAGTDAGLEIVGRFATDEIDLTRRRIAAVEITLRPLQDLDAFDVENDTATHDRVRNGKLVEIQPDRRRGSGRIVLKADAAYRIERYAGGRGFVDGQPRGKKRDVFGRADLQVAQRLAGVGVDGNADVIDALFALLRGDDDFLEPLCGRALGQRERCQGRGRNEYSGNAH